VVLLGLVWGFQRRLIYFPDARPVPAAGTVLPGARDVTLHTSDGLELGAWLVPPREPSLGVTVLVANGNGGDRAGRAAFAEALSARGLQVLLFDYRGYGGNPGAPTEYGLDRDVRAARAFLVDEAGVHPDRLVYFGESLGTAVVTRLAASQPPAGLVLRSPFVDLASVGRVHYPFLPVELLLRDRFELGEHLSRVETPVTVVFAGRDEIIPPSQSRAVAERARSLRRLVVVEGARHNDPELFTGPAVVDAVVDMADHVAGRG
jgi:fermentation-respiration switch protein FrsA (DUF1100 family)